MLANILINILGALTFLFIFWRGLREDYISEQIFTTGYFVLVGIFAVNLLALRFFPDYWFWASAGVVLAGLYFGIRRFGLRFYETLEVLALALLPWLGLVLLNDAVTSKSATSLAGTGLVVVLVGIYWYLDKHYKKYTWYKSGRIGFAGLTTLGVLFLVRTAVAPFAGSVLSFAGKYDVIASGLTSLGIFLLLWKLSKEV